MSRLGWICDGCDYRSTITEPAATVRDGDGDWIDLCSDCYDQWEEGDGEGVLA